jgi:hypothetical protein
MSVIPTLLRPMVSGVVAARRPPVEAGEDNGDLVGWTARAAVQQRFIPRFVGAQSRRPTT